MGTLDTDDSIETFAMKGRGRQEKEKEKIEKKVHLHRVRD